MIRTGAWRGSGLVALCASPAQAWAQSTEIGTAAIWLGAIAFIVAVLAAFLLLKTRAQSKALVQQSDSLAAMQEERDSARKELDAKSRELEIKLGEQIQELENENEQLSEATAKLRKLVVVDEKTGLANRMHFDQVLPHEIKRALREEKALSVILGRFDWADAFQDSYGNERYDAAVAKIAKQVRSIFRRAGDLPARYNANTFGVIFTSDVDIASRFAERLRKAVWNIPIPHESSHTADRVTLSVGVATILPNKVHDPEEFCRAAEKAVRIAEDNGGNNVEEYGKPPAQPTPV